jgi:uncharacterized membrane protein YkoI
LSGSSKITVERAPEAVQKALKTETGGAPVEDLEVGKDQGLTIYEAAFKSGGRTVELQLGEDGRVLFDPRHRNRGARRGAFASLVPLSSGQKVEPGQAPFAVRNTLVTQLGSARLEDLEKGQYNGRTIYQAAFKENGKNVELQIAEDGALVFDPRNSATGAVGAPAVGSASSKYADVKSSVTLRSSSKVSLNDAPQAVQSRIQKELNGANLEDLERGSWNGQTVYEAAFKSNGRHVELQLDQNGDVIFDPRGSAK